MSEFYKRLLSGIVYVAVIVGVIVWVPNHFSILVTILAWLACREFLALMGNNKNSLSCNLSSTAGAILWIPVVHDFAPIPTAIYSGLLIAALLLELWRKQEDPIRNWGNILISQVMIAIPFALMARICNISNTLMLAIFVIIWVNDSMAYCTGSLLSKRPGGNHKMFPRVSPGKSWEGLIGGFAFDLVAGYVFSIFEPQFSWWQWLVFALIIGIFGTLGDLMESLFKRTIGVKDSGNFMPGHGGVLDRFDSLLLATPVVYLILSLIA